MMFIPILDSIQGCALCSRGSQTLDMDLMNQWDHALPTKELGKYKDIFFGILVSKNDKIQVWYNHKVLGDLSQNKPNERGVRRVPRYEPNANAYDEVAW